MKRHAGVIVPLFGVTSTKSWGIGELPDLAPFATWLAAAGFDRVMLLPTGTLAGGDSSPYSAISAMAIDPIYIGIDDVPEFARAGGVLALGDDDRAVLQAARDSAAVSYEHVRRVKGAALERAFDHFFSDEWAQLTPAGVGAGRLHVARAMVARRSRALSGNRARNRADELARLAAAAPRTRVVGTRRGPPESVAGSASPSILTVDRGDAVAASSCAGARRPASRCSAICRSWCPAPAPRCGRGQTR